MSRPGGDQQRSTLVDVARVAGVSRQTVSNVLNNPDRVAPGTRRRVHEAIERLGFRPNLAARSLRRQRANAVGIQLSSPAHRSLGTILDPFLAELTTAADRQGTHLITFAADTGEGAVAMYEQLLNTGMVDAFVLTDTGHDDPRPEWLRRHEVPFASFGRIWDDPSFTTWVDVDGFAGIAQGVRHLHAQGYEQIGFLGWPSGSPVGDDRRAGWLAAAREVDRLDPTLQASSVQDMSSAAVAAGPLLDRLGERGAIVCASDTLALGAWSAVRERGLTTGPGLGLVGFDDSDLARAFAFTSLRQPLGDIADILIEIVLGLVSGAPAPQSGVVLEPALVQRASSTRSPTPPAGPATPPADNRTDDGGIT